MQTDLRAIFYVLRLWQEPLAAGQQNGIWRFALFNPRASQTHIFADLTALTNFLRIRTPNIFSGNIEIDEQVYSTSLFRSVDSVSVDSGATQNTVSLVNEFAEKQALNEPKNIAN